MSDFFEINGLDPKANNFRFPHVELQTFPVAWLPKQVADYIAELETALGRCELVIERLNTDRMEAHRTLRMRDYAERITGA
jgi:hypothetical protein